MPTLYAKVRYNESKKKFFTRFQKARVKKGEDKMLEPTSVKDERCEGMAVVCLESVYLSNTHATLQVKVDEVAMNFDCVMEKSLLPEPEEGELEFEDMLHNEW